MSALNKVQTADYSDRLLHATAQLSDFQELIRFADTKAGAAVTLESALLMVLLANYGPVLDLLSQRRNLWLGAITLAVSTLFLVAFIMVLYYAFLTFLPRLEKKAYKPTVAFFMDVSKMGEDAFIETVSSMPLDELLQHTLREIYLLSEILVLKFTAQRRCFQWLRLMLIFWAVAEVGVTVIQ